MKAIPVVHKGFERIKVVFPYNQEVIMQLRQIEDCRWSRTMKAWHIPATPEAIGKLKSIFPEVEYDEPKTQASENSTGILPIEAPNPKPSGNQQIAIHVLGRKILIRMPKNEADVLFIKNLKYSSWDKRNFCWVIPNYPGNLDLLKKHFGQHISSVVVCETVDYELRGIKRSIGSNEMLLIKTLKGNLRLIGLYKKEILEALRGIPYSKWDGTNKWWTLPFAESYKAMLELACSKAGIKLNYEQEVDENKGLNRPDPDTIPNYRECPEEYILKLKEMRYSENTIRTYTDLFKEFINFHFRYDIRTIDEPTIIAYLRYLVIDRKVSTSYQNQAINAIKFYYEKVLGGLRKFYFVERPLQEKTLPEVLSEAEIRAMIKMEDNIKHRAVIMVGYSAGLRVGEIVNLKLVDIDSDRMQIRIRQSKGKKDRYTVLSNKTLETLQEYIQHDNPSEWLFEGWHGRKFSSRSVQSIVKNAAKVAGIKKKVTVHTLRHSFGTHLLEHGTDIRNIQAQMGHSSIRTTQIYTHISTDPNRQIISPLDNLDL
jgi:site-specific recombinase XerD